MCELPGLGGLEPVVAELVGPDLAPMLGDRGDTDEREWAAAMNAWVFLSESERCAAIEEISVAARKRPALYTRLFFECGLRPTVSLDAASLEEVRDFLGSVVWTRKLLMRLDVVTSVIEVDTK